MRLIFKKSRLIFCTVSLLSIMAFRFPETQPSPGEIELHFKNYVGDYLLQMDSVNYLNALGQSYTISKFKYYISNIVLKNSVGKDYHVNDYFLIDQDEPESGKISLHKIPKGVYTSVSFLLGVDSLRNCSGIQQGALDPLNGMFWTWNTGYIFLKLEGKSIHSKSPGNMLEFHIGGYKKPANCIRTISLYFPDNIKLPTEKSKVTLSIKTNVAEIFKTPVKIDFAALSAVNDFNNAEMVADNYSDIFTLTKIQEWKLPD